MSSKPVPPGPDQFTSCVVVDLDALAHNVRALRAHVGAEVELYAVVKANAYGHGAVEVAHTLLDNGAQRLAVGRTDEAIQLRQAGIDAPILNLGYTVPAEAEQIATFDVTTTVNTVEGAQALAAQAEAQGKRLPVHIKVDTGMGRYGLLPGEVLPYLAQIRDLPGLQLEGIFTHFSVADAADKTYTQQQFTLFKDVLADVAAAGYEFAIRHAANSAATLDLPETHLDAVRPGVALYGMYPSTEVSTAVPLRPAMTLRSHVGRVRTLPPGSSIGYGRTYITERPTTVVLVPVGYGDGYHRLLSNRGAVLIRGQRAPIIGRVCMDQFMADATGIDDVAQDDPVVLLGQQGDAHIPAEEIARHAETINYEVTTALTPRLPRVYMQSGHPVSVKHLY